MAVGTPAPARTAASWPAPDGSSITGSPRCSSSARNAAIGRCGHRDRLHAEVGLELELGDQAVEPRAVRRPDVDGDPHPARDHVHGSGLDVDLADGCDRAFDRDRRGAGAEHVLGGGDEGVLASQHRDRPRMTGAPFERALAAHDPDDAHREPERGARALQNRPLFDVHLQEAFGELLAVGEGRAPDAATLLVAEDHDDAAARALHRLDRRDDAERTVELASVRDGVEMRAGPDARVGAAPDQVAGAVDLDRETCLLQPLRASSCARSSPEVPATRFAPTPPPMA